jgi:stage II sporulation protein AA (anti-sigma F factor antagonist)
MVGVAEAPKAAEYALVHFKGDLDVVAAPWARAEVRRRLEKDLRYLVLDFRDVTFVDSAGVSLLVFAHRAYEARHGRVMLIRVAMRVRRLLALAGILQLFEVLNSLEEAESRINEASK